MQKNKHQFLINTLIIILTILNGCSDNNSSDSKKDKNIREKINVNIGNRTNKVLLNYTIDEQKSKHRKYYEITTVTKFTIGSLSDTILYLPTDIKADNMGNIYVLDMPADCIKKFDKNGKLIRKYGKSGKGPGEFKSPFKIDITTNGKIIVIDPNLNKCEVFNKNKILSFKFKNQPTRICFYNQNEFITLQYFNIIDNAAIQKYSIKKGKLKDYQRLIDKESIENIEMGVFPFLQGILLNFKNELFYIPRYMNHFVSFNDEGKIKYAIKTMDDIDLPNLEIKNPGLMRLNFPNEQISTRDASIVDGKLYLVSNKASIRNNKGKKEYVIDIYSLEDGNYLYSFKYERENIVSIIHFFGNKMYLINHLAVVEVVQYEFL